MALFERPLRLDRCDNERVSAMPEKPLEQSIFLAALELATPAEREAYLRRTCENNEGLRAAVAELLAAHDRAGNILDAPPARLRSPGVEGSIATIDDPTEGVGKLIGSYKLIEQIGEGGMGA